MSKIDYEYLDEQYDMLPTRSAIRGDTNPQGSLTDNLRLIKPQRDGARRRARELKVNQYEDNG
jgi:hypothetical protein